MQKDLPCTGLMIVNGRQPRTSLCSGGKTKARLRVIVGCKPQQQQQRLFTGRPRSTSEGGNPRQLDHPGAPQVLIRSGVDVYFAGEALLAESRTEFCRSSLPLFLFLSPSLLIARQAL